MSVIQICRADMVWLSEKARADKHQEKAIDAHFVHSLVRLADNRFHYFHRGAA